MNFSVKCNCCNFSIDVKYASRFKKINLSTYLCKDCILKNKTRICYKCNSKITYQSPAAKRKADVLNSICKNCRSNQIPQILTTQQHEFINGLLLGDASIVYAVKNKSLYPRLTLSRKNEDKDYLFWQFEILKDFYQSGPKIKKCFDKRSNKSYEQYYLQTKSGMVFYELHKKWYPNNIKIVPRDLILSPLTLLVWFLDDGSIIKSSENGLTLKLSTHGFCKQDVIYLTDLLTNYFSEKFNIYEDSGNFFIKAATIPAMKFIQEIDCIFPSCMERKRTWQNFDFMYVINNINLFR